MSGGQAKRLAELAARLDGEARKEAERLAAAVAELEREVEGMTELAVATSKLAEIGRAAAAQNHELRQPVLAIGAVADLLREDALDPAQVRAHAQLIKEQAERMTRLLTAFRGGSVAPPEPHAAGDLARAADRVRALVSYRLKERVVLEVDVPADLPLVPLSADRLEQVLLNLVVNAIDAVEERGLPGGVVVRGRREGTAVELLVADEGTGMSADAKRRLFQPYFTTKASERGTGLGLVICRELVRAAGGTIDVGEPDLIAARAPWPRPIRTLVRVTLPACPPGPLSQASRG